MKAQETDTTQLWYIEIQGGNEFTGQILSETKSTIEFRSKTFGIIQIKKITIRKKELISTEDIKKDGVWLDNQQEGRYLFGPSSYGLRAGEGYYQNTGVVVNQISYGFTDNFSMGVGGIPLLFFGGNESPFWITPKLSLFNEEETFAMSIGALVGNVLGADDGGFGVVYGTTTFGSRDKNATIGAGYGYAGDQFADNPTLMFSGMARVGKTTYLLTENYWINAGNESLTFLSFGIRKVWKTASFDFGGFIPAASGIDRPYIFPWAGVSIPFSNNKPKF